MSNLIHLEMFCLMAYQLNVKFNSFGNVWYANSNSSYAITFTFRQIPFGKDMNPLIYYKANYELNSTIAVLLQGWL